jgi:hypothetical protein
MRSQSFGDLSNVASRCFCRVGSIIAQNGGRRSAQRLLATCVPHYHNTCLYLYNLTTLRKGPSLPSLQNILRKPLPSTNPRNELFQKETPLSQLNSHAIRAGRNLLTMVRTSQASGDTAEQRRAAQSTPAV